VGLFAPELLYDGHIPAFHRIYVPSLPPQDVIQYPQQTVWAKQEGRYD
jgi:hypothetical protein